MCRQAVPSPLCGRILRRTVFLAACAVLCCLPLMAGCGTEPEEQAALDWLGAMYAKDPSVVDLTCSKNAPTVRQLLQSGKVSNEAMGVASYDVSQVDADVVKQGRTRTVVAVEGTVQTTYANGEKQQHAIANTVLLVLEDGVWKVCD